MARTFRTLLGVTVDASRARDLDDAIWVKRLPTGFELTSCIANVAALVPIGCADDVMAESRGQTIYGITSPRASMFGPHITETLASLLPARLRPVVIHTITLTHEGMVTGCEMSTGNLQSLAKLSYEAFEATIDNTAASFHEMASVALDLATALWRSRVGKVGLPLWDAAFDRDGSISAERPPGLLGQTIVHEIMVLTNKCATEFVKSRGVNMVYRNQGPRSGGPGGRYELTPHGHTALATDAYGPFTNPIRSFVNLANQRQICAIIAGVEPPYDLADLLRISAGGNRSAQRAEAIARQRPFGEPAPMPKRWVVERLCFADFRHLIETSEGYSRRASLDLDRRIEDGLLSHSDVAWLLFSKASHTSPGQVSSILRRMCGNPSEIARIMAIAQANYGVPLTECTTLKAGDEWVSLMSIGRHSITVCDRDPVNARNFAFIAITAAALGVDDPRQNIVNLPALKLADETAATKLGHLCRLLEWDGPYFHRSEGAVGYIQVFSGSLWIGLENTIYQTPHVSSSSRESFEATATELALSQLLPLAEDALRKAARATGVDLASLETTALDEGPLEAVREFCQRYGAPHRFIWTQESPSTDMFSCTLELGSAENILASTGSGRTYDEAMETAAHNTVTTLVGHELAQSPSLQNQLSQMPGSV